MLFTSGFDFCPLLPEWIDTTSESRSTATVSRSHQDDLVVRAVVTTWITESPSAAANGLVTHVAARRAVRTAHAGTSTNGRIAPGISATCMHATSESAIPRPEKKNIPSHLDGRAELGPRSMTTDPIQAPATNPSGNTTSNCPGPLFWLPTNGS